MDPLTQWVLDTFEYDTLVRIAKHGADDGWKHLTSYRETSALYTRFEPMIWLRLAVDTAESKQYCFVLEFVASLANASYVESDEQFRQCLVQHVVQSIAVDITTDHD